MKEIKFFGSLALVSAVIAVVMFMIPLHNDSRKCKGSQCSSSDETNAPDDTNSINADLEKIDLGNVDGEFNEIDSDINSL